MKSICIKVKKELGEIAINALKNLNLLNKDLKIFSKNGSLFIPLTKSPSKLELEEISRTIKEYSIEFSDFEIAKEKPKSLLELVENALPPYLLASIPRSIDIVGNVAIVEVPEELSDYKRIIGEAILKLNKNLHTVLAKLGPTSDIYRIKPLEVIAGKGETLTIHKEHGCLYKLDLKKVYFSPRLSYEHNRVSSQVKDGEVIIDMFAGVGPFSILIAKRYRKVKVYAIDINPNAIIFLTENIILNRVKGKVIPILGDSKRLINELLIKKADRVIMNFPSNSLEFIEVACKSLKDNGGILNFYAFISELKELEELKNELNKRISMSGRYVKSFIETRIVRAIAPYKWQVAIDIEVK
ncbi:MAG: class I SAM-dependent methyltransferase family protein [Candidatus Bathyarchaeia archaeon]